MIKEIIDQHFENMVNSGKLLAIYQAGDSEKTAEMMDAEEKYEWFVYLVQSAMRGAVVQLKDQTGEDIIEFARLHSKVLLAYQHSKEIIVEYLDEGDLTYPLFATGIILSNVDLD